MSAPGPVEDAAGWSLQVEDRALIPIDADSAVGAARRAALQLAQRLGFDATRAAEIGLVATELGTNLVKHASGGEMHLRVVRVDDAASLELLAVDRGPGARDFWSSLVDGVTTSGTLGIGLGAAVRAASQFDAHSVQGRGTVVLARFDAVARPAADVLVSGVARPLAGEERSGDGWLALFPRPGLARLVVCDGLGHGPLAATATDAALQAARSSGRSSTVEEVVGSMHVAMRETRGAVAVVVDVDVERGTVDAVGVGNVAVIVFDGERRRGLPSQPGILGHQLPRLRRAGCDLPTNGLVVVHTDGITSQWDLSAHPGLGRRHPAVAAATLVRDHRVHRDDATAVVARARR